MDFIIADHTAVEVKAKENSSSQDVKPLYALAEEKKLKGIFCVSLERRRRTVDAVTVLPWKEFLNEHGAAIIPRPLSGTSEEDRALESEASKIVKKAKPDPIDTTHRHYA